ncbi:MAG: glycerol-3-phosphate 1-O-acyltransferase PlsY [Candidatus Eisenbacteria bacterium]|uniref:Glycerol-3-phosphate acyltransferase n=1 Tax=Eiseniibacteriota bacterium TaxID=2212470 RepID=A0A948RY93_UNCEI|nr:glycerol-3-phosphate 1-O-acyltransferase PlsY [Candidatus Eisenbacteria bacterium]
MALLSSYLLGSLPWGLWIGQMKGVDIRRQGSGNLGATNVARILGYHLGLMVFLLDAAKGALAVALGRMALSGGSGDGAYLPALCGVLAILGHVTTPWAGFRGGKGVATGAGTAALLMPWPCLIALSAFAGLFAITRIVSLASLTAAAVLPVSLILLKSGGAERPWLIGWALIVAAMGILRHNSNIRRLLKGEESRFGRRKGGSE